MSESLRDLPPPCRTSVMAVKSVKAEHISVNQGLDSSIESEPDASPGGQHSRKINTS